MKLVFNEQTTFQTLNYIEKISFSYHINTFDYPILHSHADYWEFTILTDGQLTNVLNSQKINIEKHNLFFTTTKDYHYLKKASAEPIRYINIIARESEIHKIADFLSPHFFEQLQTADKVLPIPIDTISEIEDIIHRVLLLPTNDHETYNSLLCCALFLIMQLIYRNRLDILKRQTDWILALNNLMQKREFFTYTVADLCSLLNYSRMQLTRLFHSDLQTTPHKFLIDSKLRYAKNLLLTTDIKVIDIANRVGFANLSSFNINFKKKYGVPPGSFRKNGKSTG